MDSENEQQQRRLDLGVDAAKTQTDDPELTSFSRYRLAVYRFAQVRLKEELNAGTPRAIAVWTAGRSAGEFYDLEPAAWALLIHALLISVAE
jgi:hypothetical protein